MGKEKLKTLEFNFSVGKSEKWNLDLDLINDNVKSDLINNGLAENVFKANLVEIKSKYKNEDIPDWIEIQKNKYLRVK